jgi:ribosome maturation factor RimP
MKSQNQDGEAVVDALDLRLSGFDYREQLQDRRLKVDRRADNESPKVKSCEETSGTISNKHLKRGCRVSHSLHV